MKGFITQPPIKFSSWHLGDESRRTKPAGIKNSGTKVNISKNKRQSKKIRDIFKKSGIRLDQSETMNAARPNFNGCDGDCRQ
jgi:hypothetical protein